MTPGKRGPKPNAAVAFLARREAIADGMDAGHKVRTLYGVHGAGLGISYSQFARYVRAYIRKKERSSKDRTHASIDKGLSGAAAPVAGTVHEGRRRDGPISTPSREHRQFIFDPTAAHRRKDELF